MRLRFFPDSFKPELQIGAIALCGLVALSTAVWVYGGFYYHDGDDPVRMQVYNGYFTGAPEYVCNTFGGLVLIGILIKNLYLAHPAVEWYDVWMAVTLALAYLLGAYWLLSNLTRHRLIAIILFSLVMASNFILVQITKSAFLLAFFALLNLVLPNRRLSVTGFLFFYSAFFLSLMTRFDTAFLAVALSFPVFLIARFGELRQASIAACMVYLALLPQLYLIYHVVNHPTTDADRLWNDIRPYSFTMVDWRESTDRDCPVYSKYCVDYSRYCPKTNADSLLLMAVENHFFFDTTFDVKILDALCVVPKDKIAFDLMKYFKSGSPFWAKLQRAMKEIVDRYLLWIPGLLLLIVFTLFYHKNSKGVNRKIILTIVLFLTTIFIIGAMMKVVDRLMYPLLQSLLTILLFYWLSMSEKALSLIVCSVLTLVLFSFTMIGVVKRVNKIESDSAQLTALYKELNRLPDGSIVCFDVKTPGFMHPGLFRKFELKPTLIPYSFDYGFLFAYPSWQQRTSELFGTVEFDDLIKQKFRSHNRETYFVFFKHRYQFFNQLAKGLYNTDLEFYPVFIFPVLIDTHNPPYKDFQIYNIKS